MPAKENLTKTTDISSTLVREIDFVTRFSQTWKGFSEIMGIMRPIAKEAGTTLRSYKGVATLADGAVGEGEVIPYSQTGVEEVAHADLIIEKYAKAVSIEAVNKYGAKVAVQKTDEAFLKELQGKVLTEMFTFLGTGTLTGSEADFQAAVANAIGMCKNKFEKARLDATNIAVFVNTLDFYRYLGSTPITVQTQFGLTYLKNYLGADTVIITSEVEQGKVHATPAANLVLYYVNPASADFGELGLKYTVEGETNLIGFHANGNYSTAVGESFAIMGMKLWAEYLDGIAVVTIGGASPANVTPTAKSAKA